MPSNLEVTALAGVGEALEGKEEGLVVIEETQVEDGECLVSMVESLVWVTKLAIKARVAIAKIK